MLVDLRVAHPLFALLLRVTYAFELELFEVLDQIKVLDFNSARERVVDAYFLAWRASTGKGFPLNVEAFFATNNSTTDTVLSCWWNNILANDTLYTLSDLVGVFFWFNEVLRIDAGWKFALNKLCETLCNSKVRVSARIQLSFCFIFWLIAWCCGVSLLLERAFT